MDLINDDLPKVDLIIVRDCLVHFSNKDIFKAIENIKQSKSKYLLVTTFSDLKKNENIVRSWNLIVILNRKSTKVFRLTCNLNAL